FSKIVSEEWKKLSETEKAKWQRKYHISRDQKLQKAVVNDDVNEASERSNIAITNLINNKNAINNTGTECVEYTQCKKIKK
ncbi:4030_t:CDS:1, partial [Funneliformis caledonium]